MGEGSPAGRSARGFGVWCFLRCNAAKTAGTVITNHRTKDNLSGAEELHRMREMFARSPSFSALLQGPEHRFVLTNPAYHQLIGHRNVIGLTVREAVPEVAGQGFLAML